ncbi:glycosyltransferase [Seonamhaeicola sp. MEBiC1930]|uniref:glycosyltransferase n=1 Tax=Seonamhaeicola sp. MEBiC01930 TaxID=2976768 RepID=UPI0032476B2B
MKNNKKTVGLLIDRLSGGGAERSAGLISTILSNLGYEVFIIVLFDDVVYPYSGKLINLGKYKSGSRSIKNKLWRYWKIKDVIIKNQCDLLLDFRIKDLVLREFVLNKVVLKTKVVNMVRSSNLELYFTKNKWLAKYLYKNYCGINVVSHKMQELVEKRYGFRNVKTIYNSIDFDYVSELAQKNVLINEKFVIAVGRLDPVKQFDKLIEAYSKSILPSNNIQLFIIGSGDEEVSLRKIVDKNNLTSKVKLFNFQENVFKYISKSEFLVLSSEYEGFPRVLLESMACGVPVVSFNCDTGPDEIVINEVNGLLVENQDFVELTKAMNNMIDNKELYKKLRANSIKSVQKFSLKSINDSWDVYMKYLISFKS